MADGRAVCLRPLNAKDAPLIEAGISALSDRSRYLRFFSGFKHAPQPVLDLLTNFDDDNHLAWGAVDMSLDDKPAIAAAHIIRTESLPDNRGDFSVAVLDDYHNQGIARAIMQQLFSEAVSEGFTHVELDVLIENRAAISMFKWLGGKTLKTVGNVVHMEVEIRQALSVLDP
jgi:ribosomal protein S18 acetylase RimI-like enzyme